MADLDEEADLDNCDIVEELFGATREEEAAMVRRAREARAAIN